MQQGDLIVKNEDLGQTGFACWLRVDLPKAVFINGRSAVEWDKNADHPCDTERDQF